MYAVQAIRTNTVSPTTLKVEEFEVMFLEVLCGGKYSR